MNYFFIVLISFPVVFSVVSPSTLHIVFCWALLGFAAPCELYLVFEPTWSRIFISLRFAFVLEGVVI